MHSLIKLAIDFHNGNYPKSAYDFALDFIHQRRENKEPEIGLEGEVIGSLFLACDRFEPDIIEPDEDGYEINEAQFKIEVEKLLLQLNVIQ